MAETDTEFRLAYSASRILSRLDYRRGRDQQWV